MEIAIISGKGGTGKSSISAAFTSLEKRVVLADCDVDAANLHLLFTPSREEETVYVSGHTAVIDYNVCNNCKLCMEYCRFDAIFLKEDVVTIDSISCDGCKLCYRVCPESAIEMVESNDSRMYAGTFRYGKMVYGRLAPGEENSGKLVNLVREKARNIAEKEGIEKIIIDGPPGIGCSAISSVTGVNTVAVVTEPTLSGLHDLKRALQMTSIFDLDRWVIINKYDLNNSLSDKIESYCQQNGIKLAGKLPFDPILVEAMVKGQSVIEYSPESEISKRLSAIYVEISADNLLRKP